MPEPDAPPQSQQKSIDALARLLAVLARLRAPDGCPWDRVQTVATLAPYLLEEAYEAVDAIGAARAADTNEELGDCLMNVLMLAMAGETEGTMSVESVADGIANKLVRRHPHVFGETQVSGVGEVWKNWERIKAEEKRAKREDDSALAGIPRSLPALFRALRTVEKASRAGFRYGDLASPLAKVDEEWREVRAEIVAGDKARAAEEMGDLLLALAVVAHHLEVNPELALRRSVERFEARFRRVEAELGARLKDAPHDELLAAWGRAKVASPPSQK
jgi:MazG family protein